MSSIDIEQTDSSAGECAGCTLHEGRREFLREAGITVAGILAVLGVPTSARALPLRLAGALAFSGTEATYALPPADGVTIDKAHELILVRWQGAVYAFRLSCPHQKTALKWKESDARFQCPKHKSKYQPDGTFISGRATRGMDRYAVRRQGGELVVDLAKSFREDKDKAGWKAAVVRI